MTVEQFIFGDAARKGAEIDVAMKFLAALMNLDCSDDDGHGELLRARPTNSSSGAHRRIATLSSWRCFGQNLVPLRSVSAKVWENHITQSRRGQ
jgi:hypothetical protein